MRFGRVGAALAGVAAAAAIAAPAALGSGPFEPNNTQAQAHGPLLEGQRYVGGMEAAGDVDWFYFDVENGRPIRLTLAWASDGHSLPGCGEAELTGANGGVTTLSGGTGGRFSGFSHISRFALDGTLVAEATRYYLELNAPAGCRYALSFGPPDSRPVVPPQGCEGAVAGFLAGRFDVPDNRIDENCDGRLDFRSRGIMSASGVRYLGRVASAEPGCRRGRTVLLRRVGDGQRNLARTRTTASGGFAFPRRAPRTGRVYAVIRPSAPAGLRCLAGTSPRIRA